MALPHTKRIVAAVVAIARRRRKRSFVRTVSVGAWTFLALAAGLLATATVPAVAGGVVDSPGADAVRLEGRLGGRYDVNVDRLIQIHEHSYHKMIRPFRYRGSGRRWDGAYAGKWLDAASMVAANTGRADLTPKVDAFAETLRDLQAADGYMGIEADRSDQWDVWNQWYALTGWLSHAEYRGDADSLAAARKCGTWLVGRHGPITGPDDDFFHSDHHGGCNADVLDQMVRLYEVTGEERFHTFAGSIAANYEQIRRMRGGAETPHHHAYVVTAYLGGTAELARIRGDEDEPAWVGRAWQDLRDHHLYPTGSLGAGERIASPVDRADGNIQETCATVEWMILSRRLYEATGQTRYAEAIEETVYNALLAAQSVDGTKWDYYTPLRYRKSWWEGPTDCCYWSGPRGIARLPMLVYAADEDGLRVDLFESSAGEVEVDAETVRVEQATGYPADGGTQVRLGLDAPRHFEVKLRVPAWACDASVLVNGRPADVSAAPRRHVGIARTWSDGDEIALEFSMPAYLKPLETQGVAVTRGPEVLAVDTRDNPGLDLDAIRIPSMTELDLRETDPAADGRRRYEATVTVDGALRRIVLTPYADCGNDGARFRTVFDRGKDLEPLARARCDEQGGIHLTVDALSGYCVYVGDADGERVSAADLLNGDPAWAVPFSAHAQQITTFGEWSEDTGGGDFLTHAFEWDTGVRADLAELGERGLSLWMSYTQHDGTTGRIRVVPEPATVFLLTGAAAAAVVRRRR